ncbi:hypothetical protein V6N13_119555 [Hibiscus sabdariffa]|uniref:Non-specific lipid-transfer protein n=1 Tax=Hibiscus sabdariffa TaxID=183260 RepID=A0ABR2E3E9_9ROSI
MFQRGCHVKAAACVGFATGKDAKALCRMLQWHSAACSGSQIRGRCLKTGAKSFGIQDRLLSRIPQACNIKVGFPVSINTKVGFPVSINTNCET